MCIRDSLNNLWDDISGDETEAGDVEYRGIYIMNTNDSDSFLNIKLWISEEIADAQTKVDIGIEAPVMQSIANESTAPSGITFSHPVSESEGIDIPDLGASEYYGIWIRRTVTAGDSHGSSLGYTLSVKGETL